jgi:hypothetical protein
MAGGRKLPACSRLITPLNNQNSESARVPAVDGRRTSLHLGDSKNRGFRE